jgi:hypothetical protein
MRPEELRRELDVLAAEAADTELAERLAGVQQKARSARRRRVGSASAAAAVVAVAAFALTAQVLDGGGEDPVQPAEPPVTTGTVTAPNEPGWPTYTDAPGETKPAFVDITALNVRNGPDALVVEISAADVRRKAAAVSVDLAMETGRDFVVRAYAQDTGGMYVVIAEPDGGGTESFLTCAGATGDENPARDTITLTVPQACFGADAGDLEIAATLYRYQGGEGSGPSDVIEPEAVVVRSE